MLYSKRISEIGYYILKILPTSSKYWIYKKRHLEKASLKGITSVFTHLAMKMIAQHTSGRSNIEVFRAIYGGFLKWWYPTTMGFPTKNDHFGVFWGYHHLRKHPYIYIYMSDGLNLLHPRKDMAEMVIVFCVSPIVPEGLVLWTWNEQVIEKKK